MSEIKEAETKPKKEVIVDKDSNSSRKSIINDKPMEKKEAIPFSTYLSIDGADEDSKFEMDLVFVREKGTSTQVFEITFTTYEKVAGNNVAGEKIAVERRKTINSKEEFELVKNYFAKLTWD